MLLLSPGGFTQADSVIPAGVQGLDRYAAMENNPVRYNDPTGHMVSAGLVGEGGGCDRQCWDERNKPKSPAPKDNPPSYGDGLIGPPPPEYTYEFIGIDDSEFEVKNLHLLDKKTFGMAVIYSNGEIIGYKEMYYRTGKLRWIPDDSGVFNFSRGPELALETGLLTAGKIAASKLATKYELVALLGPIGEAVAIGMLVVESVDYLYGSTNIEVSGIALDENITFYTPLPFEAPLPSTEVFTNPFSLAP